MHLLLLLVVPLLAAQDPPRDKCSLSGAVLDSKTGEPLTKVLVIAEATNHIVPASTSTDAKGRFTLVDLEPGQYRLKGVRNGYLDTYYGAERAGSKGIPLTLEAGAESKDLKIKLLPFAVIAGAVRDPEGEPLAGMQIELLEVSYRTGKRKVTFQGGTATTDDLGQYRMANIPPGRYYLRAGPQPRGEIAPADHSPKDTPAPEVLVPTFYPASRELAGAQRIELAAGSRFLGADVTLARSRLFRVTVRAEGPPGLGLGIGLHENLGIEDQISVAPASTCDRGTCVFRGVHTGSYLATASASVDPTKISLNDFMFNANKLSASVPVEVANADVDGVVVTVNAGAEVAGRVVVEGDAPPDRSRSAVYFRNTEGEEHWADVNQDGTFACRLSQGRYEVNASGVGLIARSIHAGDTDVLQDGLVISRAGKLPLEVVLARDGGKIDGVVKDGHDQPAAGATVVLIPEAKRRFRHELFQESATDQYGRYQFKQVPPGEYKLFAWPDVEQGIWFDPDFLKDVEARGESVTIEAKGQQTSVLKLIELN